MCHGLPVLLALKTVFPLAGDLVLALPRRQLQHSTLHLRIDSPTHDRPVLCVQPTGKFDSLDVSASLKTVQRDTALDGKYAMISVLQLQLDLIYSLDCGVHLKNLGKSNDVVSLDVRCLKGPPDLARRGSEPNVLLQLPRHFVTESFPRDSMPVAI